MRPTRPPLHQYSPSHVPLSKEKPDLNKKVHEVPHKPGVYLMRDRFGRVIYVGKARDLRKRVGSYFMPSKMAVADLKTRAMLEAVWDFETHTVASEAESLLLEGKLIKEYRPRYNISFRDDKRFLVVKVDPTEEWPRFRLARFKKDDGARYFGPYAHAGALRQTLNFMRKKFGVLTFGRGAPTERELKVIHLPGADAIERNRRRNLSRACCAGGGISRGTVARNDPCTRGRDAQSGGETGFRESSRAAQHARGSAAHDKADAAFHPPQPAEHDRSAGRCPGAGRRAPAAAFAQGDGMLRHLEYFHHPCRRLDGRLSRRRAGQKQLPALSHSDGGRTG